MKISGRIILCIAILIAVLGVLSIYSSTYEKEGEGWQDVYKRQILWILFGVAVFLVMANLDYRNIWEATYFLYAAVLFLLIMVFFLGTTRLGAQRWLRFAGLNFQPSEVVKLVIVIFLARYYSMKSVNDVSLLVGRLGLVRGLLLPLAGVGLPALLVIRQPDLGSGAIVLLIFVMMLYLSGVRLKYIISLLAAVALALPVLWNLLRGYQRERLLVFLDPNIDPLGAGYTVIQSKIAIGSSGFFGKGWLSGTQSQLHFLPESHTDFIFATFTEEWGLFGAGILLMLYFLLVRQAMIIALRTNDYFGKMLALGICVMIAIQISVNIAMTLGLAPVVGLPLPLLSYGGSSMLVTFAALGILASIDKRRAVF
ncbi:rod shape-determining protein RodA [Candidatus Omnitrophota bacterium]